MVHSSNLFVFTILYISHLMTRLWMKGWNHQDNLKVGSFPSVLYSNYNRYIHFFLILPWVFVHYPLPWMPFLILWLWQREPTHFFQAQTQLISPLKLYLMSQAVPVRHSWTTQKNSFINITLVPAQVLENSARATQEHFIELI